MARPRPSARAGRLRAVIGSLGQGRPRFVGTAIVTAFGATAAAGCGSDGKPLDTSPAARAMAHERSEPADPTPSPTPTLPGHGAGESVLFANPKHRPLRVGAGGGHVVAVRATAGGSVLLDITQPAAKTLTRFDGGVTTPTVGTDASGKAVAVVSPCQGAHTSTGPGCPLIAVDLASGARRDLVGTEHGSVGAMDRGRVAFVRLGPTYAPEFVAQTTVGGAFQTLPLTTAKDHGQPGRYALSRSERVESIDYRDGILAAVVLYDGGDESGGSGVFSRAPDGSWTRYGGTGYGIMDGVEVAFRAIAITPTGIRGYADGGAESQPYVARWTFAGKRASRIGVKSRMGIDASAAFDGDHLITAGKIDAQDGTYAATKVGDVVSSGPYDLG